MWRVILADDEKYILTGLKTLIPWPALDCEIVAEATGGKELIELVNARGADIAIMDIRMPGMNGLDAAAILRREHPEIVLIFLTGYEDFEYARAAVSVGASAYIVKTEVLEELPAAIQKAAFMLAKSRVPPEPPAMIALFRSLCDGTFRIRRSEDVFSGAYETLSQDFSTARLLAVQLAEAVSDMELDNLKLLLESSFRRFSPALFPMEDTRLCLMLRRADVAPEDIAAECEVLLPVAESFCGLRVAIAISKPFANPEGMRSAYAEVGRLLSRRLIDGDTCVHYSLNCEADGGKTARPESLMPLLSRAKADEMDAWVDGFIHSARGMDLLTARSECLRALSDMAGICYHYDKALSPPGGCDFHAAILTCQTLKGLKDILRTAMEQTSSLIRREDEKIHTLIKDTNAYIAVHAYEKVSLADIANAVHANPSHLSRFYKEKTGRNLFDVINGLRIERACELMRTTDWRTYEIADAVGFSDTSNFSKFFKKHTGFSPREYARQE